MSPVLTITEYPVQEAARTWRFEAPIGGKPIFFEADVPLVSPPESLATCLLLPAMFAGMDMAAEAPMCATWLDNNRRVRELACQWWNLRDIRIRAASHAGSPGISKAGAARRDRVGLFFTGGVDSFYSLVSSLDRVDALIFVEGFDIPLSDTARLAETKDLCRSIATESSKRFITLRTNLRQHPAVNDLAWGMTHGSALATIGHILGGELDEIRIATTDAPPPHGSHPLLDKWWSSQAVAFVSDGTGASRLEKVVGIKDHPLVHQHLRVCWENRNADLNCGVCEKCVRTQAQFAAAGTLGDLRTFPAGDLADRIDGIAAIPSHLVGQWRAVEDSLPPGREKDAVSRLVGRTTGGPGGPGGRTLRDTLGSWVSQQKKRRRISLALTGGRS